MSLILECYLSTFDDLILTATKATEEELSNHLIHIRGYLLAAQFLTTSDDLINQLYDTLDILEERIPTE